MKLQISSVYDIHLLSAFRLTFRSFREIYRSSSKLDLTIGGGDKKETPHYRRISS